jgi:hypothetical protein
MNQIGFVITRPRLNVAFKLMRQLREGARQVERGQHAKQQGKGEAEAHLSGASQPLAEKRYG